MTDWLEQILLDGLDGAGSERFDAWLLSERQDAKLALVDVLRQLATHPLMAPITAEKWFRLWREADPTGAESHQKRAFSAALEVDIGIQQETHSPLGQASVLSGSQPSTTAEPLANSSKTKDLTAQALRAQKIRFCEVRDGTKIAYATLGSGAPFLKAANWLNHLEFDWNSPIWGRSFAEIARYRTFVRYDERGFGLSDWGVEDLTFDAFVEDLEVVADKSGYDRFPLLGISQGCAVAIEYAVRHPARITGLVLVGGYAAGWRHHTSPEEQNLRETVMAQTKLGWGTNNSASR